MNFVSDYKNKFKQPIYIKFNCSGDYCNEDFYMVVRYKYFIIIQHKTRIDADVEEMVCCPHCGHIQILTIVSFLQLDEDKYFAI